MSKPALIPVPTEHQEQVAFIQECDYLGPPFNRVFAIPNGGDRHPAVGAKLKAEGVRSGIPDLFLPIVRLPYHGLFIEMKRQKGGKLSTDQEKKIRHLIAAGYAVIVPEGAVEAMHWTHKYLKGEKIC